jgi:hypothetical protein
MLQPKNVERDGLLKIVEYSHANDSAIVRVSQDAVMEMKGAHVTSHQEK